MTTRQVLKGYARVVNSHIIGPDWAINPNLNKYEYNPDKAKALLAEAGWDPNTPVVINWMAGQGGRDVENALLIAQSQLQAVGINADFQPLERGPLLEAITGRKFDLVSYGGGVYTVDPDSTSYVLMCQFTQPKGANNAGYCNEQVDRLFMQGRAATDQAMRAMRTSGRYGPLRRVPVCRIEVAVRLQALQFVAVAIDGIGHE